MPQNTLFWDIFHEGFKWGSPPRCIAECRPPIRAALDRSGIYGPKVVAPTLTNERMVADAEEMAEWARKTFSKRKIFVLGHSYGSYLGLELATRHPDWLYAYIGVGQVANMPESERRGWQFAMDAARQEGNADAIRELQSIAPYPAPGKGSPIDEIRHLWDGNAFATPFMLPPDLLAQRSTTTKFDVPLNLFEARYDRNVNADVSVQWFAQVQAPEKHLVWFERSAHLLITEEPGKVLISLVRYALPIAVLAGDGAP